MIGQTHLLETIDRLIQNGFPRFILLVGEKGSGKKLMSREIANKLGFPLVPIGVGVDEVREVITNSYRNTEPIVYVIPDTDKMSVAAKNALLKITEEPPQKAYFIMTVTNNFNTLGTILSRACVLTMDGYTNEELREYLVGKYPSHILTTEDVQFLLNIASVPQQIDTLMTYDVAEFKTYVDTVAQHLHTVSSANAFKIENKLALKKDEDKWDMLLFVQALRVRLVDLFITTKQTQYYDVYRLASNLVVELKYKNSVNRQYCMDKFIIEMRKCWRGE